MPILERIIIHPGLPKAGSTSFQFWCDTNREIFRQQGVTYPRGLKPEKPKHAWMPFVFYGELANLKAEIEACETPTLMLSHEGLARHVCYQPEEALSIFRNALVAYEVELFVMFREPREWLRSFYGQCVMVRHLGRDYEASESLELFERRADVQRLLDRDGILTDLKNTFNAARVVTASVDDDWRTTFSNAFGLEADAGEEPRLHPGPPRWKIELARQLNAMKLADDDKADWRLAVHSFRGPEDRRRMKPRVDGQRPLSRTVLQAFAPTDHPEFFLTPDILRNFQNFVSLALEN